MKFFILMLLVLCGYTGFSQEKAKNYFQDVNVSFGKSKLYSGDIPGIKFTTEYSKYIKRRRSLVNPFVF